MTVMIDGKPAPISFVNDNQINAIVPQDTAVGNVQVIVSNAAGSSAAKTVQMTADAPGFFTVDGRHVAGVVLDSAGGSTLLAPAGSISGATSRAAKAGETVTLFGSGFGRTQGAVNPNLAQSFAVPLAHTTGDFQSAQATLTIGGQPATISFIGICPDFPDKQANNRNEFIAGVGLTPQRAIRYQGGIRGVRRPTFPFKSSDPAPVLRPDTALILDYVPNIKSNDCNKFVSVVRRRYGNCYCRRYRQG